MTVDLLPKDSRGKTISLKALADLKANQDKRRELAAEMWRTQIKEAADPVEWINDNFGLSEQFNSASKIGDGRFQYYKGMKDFTPTWNESIKESGYKVVNEGGKYFIETLDGKRVKQIDRFGKTQSNSNWALAKVAKSFKKFFGDLLPKDSRGKTISLKALADLKANQDKRRELAAEMWRTQIKEAADPVEWINDNFGLSEQFNSASKIGDGRFTT